MKVIFLDIDGVLNSATFMKQNPNMLIDEQRVILLSKLVHQTNAKVVLHSGWRFRFDNLMQPQTDEAKYLCKLLHKHNIYLYDKTPDLSTPEIRKTQKFSLVKAKEIMTWLGCHGDVNAFVVLEDLDLDNLLVRAHQIKTNNLASGLSENDIESASNILNSLFL